MSDVPRPLPPKKDVALALLEREPSVFIHLDPRKPGVSVPKWFTGQPQLVLQIGMNMAIPIPDLKVDDEGISCTLSFNRAPFLCRLPWHAIWALVSEDQRGMVWPDDIPPDLAAQKQQRPAPAGPQKPTKRARPRLAAVGTADGEQGDAHEPSRQAPEPEGKRGEVAQLRPLAPAPAPAEAPQATAADERRDEAGEPSGAEAGPRPGSGKPKRELPPYLRVIK